MGHPSEKVKLMKNFKVVALAVVCFFIAGSVHAQTKIGYIDAETILYLMPEAKKADTLLRQYQVDTIGKEYQNLLTTYQWKDSLYKDSVKTPKAVRDQYGKDLQELVYQLQNWQQIAQEASQAKQNELMAPLMKKISDAINAVSKEKGYTHVMSRDAFIVAPDADNLLLPVAAKLKITVPAELQPGYKAPAGGAKPPVR